MGRHRRLGDFVRSNSILGAGPFRNAG
jgi:hypothetical protein